MFQQLYFSFYSFLQIFKKHPRTHQPQDKIELSQRRSGARCAFRSAAGPWMTRTCRRVSCARTRHAAPKGRAVCSRSFHRPSAHASPVHRPALRPGVTYLGGCLRRRCPPGPRRRSASACRRPFGPQSGREAAAAHRYHNQSVSDLPQDIMLW